MYVCMYVKRIIKVSKMTWRHCTGTVQSGAAEGNGEKLTLEVLLEDIPKVQK